MGIYDNIARQEEIEEREQKRFYHSKYRVEFLSSVYSSPARFIGDVYEEDPDRKGELLYNEAGMPYIPVDYSKNQTIICCPEPIEFIKAFNSCMNNQDKCKDIMKNLISEEMHYGKAKFKKIHLDHMPKDKKWFNSTKGGVNLRPGILNGDLNKVSSIRMADVAVHGLIAGRTGSGKSVFLNNIILNLLLEYAPWELDLYLADFKKVELSRYMTKYETPHLKTCAATSEIRYVVTMLQHLVDCMQARQDLFTRLGIQKISEFRDRFGVVLPRVVLIIDEFQQMFQEAVNEESRKIHEALMSITKLGRATGFHLLFASQEMGGTLTGKAMANFKIRFALQCDSEVSSSILGNKAAATLDRGYVLVNTGSGKLEENQKFKVPFIPEEDSEESYFYALLHELYDDAKSFFFEKNKTFYQEDYQLPIEKLEDVLIEIEDYKSEELEKHKTQYLDIFTLGRGVVYTDKKYDLESCYLERGRNKNILSICSSVDDLAYLKKLLAVNFRNSPNWNRYKHVVYELNPVLYAKYDIKKDLMGVSEKLIVNHSTDGLVYIESAYRQRFGQVEAAKQKDVASYIKEFFRIVNVEATKKDAYDSYKARLEKLFAGTEINDIKKRCDEILKQDKRYWEQIEPVYNFYLYKVEKKAWSEIFTPIVYWISGFEYIEEVDKGLPKIMKNGMDVNVLFLLFTDSTKSIDPKKEACIKTCEYIFVNSADRRIYDKFDISFTNKRRNSIAIDFKIRSLNTERAFKKYSVKGSGYSVPEIDFDALLSGKIH